MKIKNKILPFRLDVRIIGFYEIHIIRVSSLTFAYYKGSKSFAEV